MKNGYKTFDSDMHVYDAAGLYEKYMNPKWGERIPKGQRNGKHGRVEFKLGGGEKMRAITDVINHGQQQVAERYAFAVARDYDPSRCCSVLRRCIATKPWNRSMPTIYARPGTAGSPTSAKKIPSGSKPRP
jgi:hypothetical protein